jgi:hypothetical protein
MMGLSSGAYRLVNYVVYYCFYFAIALVFIFVGYGLDFNFFTQNDFGTYRD